MYNILVCDDDREIVDAIEIYLTQEGYHVLKAYDGMQAIQMLEREEIQLLITAVMMPKLDGTRATLKIREKSSIPIIILSAKSEDVDKILGLNIGADDYVTKPFNPLELVARVKSQLRRYTKLGNLPADDGENVYQVGGLLVNDDLKEVTYEGYGVGGVAVIVETMTDNLNRTVPDVRHCFSKTDGNLGTNGSVAFLFTKRGEITFEDVSLEDQIMEVALEAGAEDIEVDEDQILVITTPEAFGDVQDALSAAGLKSDNAEVVMSPSTKAEITDIEQAKKILKMIDMFEDLDDVQNVYTNVEFSDEVLAELDA